MTRSRAFLAVLTLSVLIMRTVPRTQQAPGLTSSTVAGLRFRTIGPAAMSGRIVDIAVVESNTHTFYAASATGGLWKTTDNGTTFAPVFQNESVPSIGCVTVSQSNPSIVWVGTGEATNRQSSGWGDGVYRSTDAGRTWTNMGLKDSEHIGRILLHPSNADIVYVAALGHLWGPNKERGLYKSVDGGRTWQPSLQVDEDTGVSDVAMDSADSNTLYAASYQRRRRAYGFHGGGPGSALYKSTDAGEHWTKLTKGLPAGDYGRIGISVYRKDPRIVYASVEQGLRYNASTAYEERKGGIYRSEDKGETWTFMSDWNPRPDYSSQIRVDPSDDKRVYVVEYSYSDDGGKTFVHPRQSLHGDDRVVWVDPRDSRHLLKGDDGGLGVSYDRGVKWLYVTSLPVTQWYHVAVDMRKPYWVYGGLQDNGCWRGPSATYFSSGITNDDWIRTCGGDGFKSLADPDDDNTFYSESQYLGLVRNNSLTNEWRDIRPGNKHGAIQARRNWKVWGKPGAKEPELGNAIAPANWDGPFILSPHDSKTIYAGTNQLWKSTDRGETWTSLGDMTTGVVRSTLRIMGQLPTETTLALDDGIPYYPTISEIAESPVKRGLLYVGTDDGNLQVSQDDGKHWANLTRRIPGLPETMWVSGIEASRHNAGTVYVSFDGHRSNDFKNYLYRSTDFGNVWTSIAGDLPANRVIHAVHEDPKNPNLVYVGTEHGLYLSADAGHHWIEFGGSLPRVPVNDFVIHPRDNDLVLATHGRGVWILDNITALQELTPPVLSESAHLFATRVAEEIRYFNPKPHAGDMLFRGDNPAAGATIDYYLHGDPGAGLGMTIMDAAGKPVVKLQPANAQGINRIVWNLRYESLPAPPPDEESGGRTAPVPGPLVTPGEYTVRLTAAGKTYDQKLNVVEDPRIQVSATDRRLWTETLLSVAETYRGAVAIAEQASRADGAPGPPASQELRDLARELRSRALALYRAIGQSTGTPTADQQTQAQYFKTELADLRRRTP
jgi:Sortilin, neurotensin receptor 3,